MIPYERRKQMLQQLEESELVTLEDFCEVLPGVSQSTVRRDLKTLEDEGPVSYTHLDVYKRQPLI